ncbi:hypothetical protein ID866_6668 [Astraeus odoratus]|nr:hypothetical protein ID866_6668 [Astraeus odoratus]
MKSYHLRHPLESPKENAAGAGQGPATGGGTVPIQGGCTCENNETSNVIQSTDALVAHWEGDKGKQAVKASVPPDAYQIGYHDLGVAKEAFVGLVRMNDKCLRVLKDFIKVVDTVGGPLANLNPIAQVAVGLVTKAARTILDQDSYDESVSALLTKVQEVYEFLQEEDTLQHIQEREQILLQIAQVVSNCAEFISKYSEKKSFAPRFAKQFFSDTQSNIDDLNQRLDALMQLYRDRAVQSIHINVLRLSDDCKIDGMRYAKEVGMMTAKKCLDGTREQLLADIMRWINDPDPNMPRMFYLYGQAGRGKSAIAHTIALWCKNAGILGSCFCFARDRQAEHLERRIFTTIAHDLANRDLLLRRAVADAITADDSLKTTPDAIQQWEKLIVPASEVSSALVGKVVIVIDALDEAEFRKDILPILATRVSSLPPSFRILITSRPLPDVQRFLMDLPHARNMTLDGVPTEDDIHLYITTELANENEIGETEVRQLARKSDGLFEWARLACEYIKTSTAGQTVKERFDDVMSHGSEEGNLLDAMYNAILDSAIGKKPRTLKRFRSVMHQVLSIFEPLPMDTLDVMRTRFPHKTDHYRVKVILEFMGALLSGVTDTSMPIRPLHTSFYDFLANPLRSGDYCVVVQTMDAKLASASLSILCSELRFNICNLETSYLCNTEVTDLVERIAVKISSQLSYSCRFWMKHLQQTEFTTELAIQVRSILGSEKVLFWFEVLSLLNAWGSVGMDIQSTGRWLQGQKGFEDVAAMARDCMRFV